METKLGELLVENLIILSQHMLLISYHTKIRQCDNPAVNSTTTERLMARTLWWEIGYTQSTQLYMKEFVCWLLPDYLEGQLKFKIVHFEKKPPHFFIVHLTREIFTHMETSQLPVKGCKFWPMLSTRLLAVKVL